MQENYQTKDLKIFLEFLINNNTPVINTYRQTETGAIMIAPLPVNNSILKRVRVPTHLIIPTLVNIDPVTREVLDCEIKEKGILLFSYNAHLS